MNQPDMIPIRNSPALVVPAAVPDAGADPYTLPVPDLATDLPADRGDALERFAALPPGGRMVYHRGLLSHSFRGAAIRDAMWELQLKGRCYLVQRVVARPEQGPWVYDYICEKAGGTALAASSAGGRI